MKASAERLQKTVCALADGIGVRLAGSPQEYEAARYLARACEKVGCRVSIEEFPVKRRSVYEERLEVNMNGVWQSFPCSLFSSACGTDGQTVTAELVYFDTATGYQRPDLSFLTGKAVVHLGCHIENEDAYRRLMAAKPAFILFVDTRYPAAYALADGLFPAYVKAHGSVPSLNVAYMDAWSWKGAGAVEARICVKSEQPTALTSVMVAELPGTDPQAGVLYVGGHHDTQAGTPGADDNASGSAAVVELAQLLSGRPHRRTIRFCSFGAEEQLSAGSAAYVRQHRAELTANAVFMCNFDSYGSVLGWSDFTVNGTDALRGLLKKSFNDAGIYYVERTKPCPYTDQFPFAACGVPGIWLYRPNCAAGQFYHHRVDNTPDKIDFATAAQYVGAAADVLDYLADVEDLTPYRGIPADQQTAIDELFGAVYGGF